MDKVTPKSDLFRANLDRAAPLLAKLKAEGISHMIDGKIVPSISGATFETKSPIDGAVLANVARGNAEDIDRAATAASLAFKPWRDMSAAMRRKLLHRVADAMCLSGNLECGRLAETTYSFAALMAHQV